MRPIRRTASEERRCPRPTDASTCAPTPSRRRRPRCASRWRAHRSATTSTARTRRSTGSRSWPPTLLGKEAALFTASGTMANQLAIRVLARPGTEILCPARAHVYRYEAAAVASNSGRADPAAARRRTASSSPARDRGRARRAPPPLPADLAGRRSRTRTCRRAAGRRRPSEVRRPRVGRGRARASRCTATAPASSTPRSRWRRRVHALAAPDRHRDVLRLEGPRRAGRVAAVRPDGGHRRGPGATAALRRRLAAGRDARRRRRSWPSRRWSTRLAEDHARAQRLAVALAERFPGSLDPDAGAHEHRVRPRRPAPGDVPRPCSSRAAIRAGTIDPETVRLVTHKDVDDADVDRTIAAFDALALEAVEARRTRSAAERVTRASAGRPRAPGRRDERAVAPCGC